MTFRYDIGDGYVTDGTEYYFHTPDIELNDEFDSYWSI